MESCLPFAETTRTARPLLPQKERAGAGKTGSALKSQGSSHCCCSCAPLLNRECPPLLPFCHFLLNTVIVSVIIIQRDPRICDYLPAQAEQNVHTSRWVSQGEVLLVIQILNNHKFNGRKWGNLNRAPVGENKEKEVRFYCNDREKIKGQWFVFCLLNAVFCLSDSFILYKEE